MRKECYIFLRKDRRKTMSKLVIVASKNPVKIQVAKNAFAAVWPNEEFTFEGIEVSSGVHDQPMEGEAREGAFIRLANAEKGKPDADFWIAQEGGLFEEGRELYSRAWIAVKMKGDKVVVDASTASFRLPPEIGMNIRRGMELGDASDLFFNSKNMKHRSGAIGALTGSLVTRTDYYTQAAIIALSELKNKEWYR